MANIQVAQRSLGKVLGKIPAFGRQRGADLVENPVAPIVSTTVHEDDMAAVSE